MLELYFVPSCPCFECDGKNGLKNDLEVCFRCKAINKKSRAWLEYYGFIPQVIIRPKREEAKPSYHRKTYNKSFFERMAEKFGYESFKDMVLKNTLEDLKVMTGVSIVTLSRHRRFFGITTRVKRKN